MLLMMGPQKKESPLEVMRVSTMFFGGGRWGSYEIARHGDWLEK